MKIVTKKVKRTVSTLSALFFCILSPLMVKAAINPPAGVPTDPKSLATQLITWVLGISGLLSVIMIVVGGIQITTSAGESDKHKKAVKTITYAIVGLVVTLAAYSIVAIVGNAVTGTN